MEVRMAVQYMIQVYVSDLTSHLYIHKKKKILSTKTYHIRSIGYSKIACVSSMKCSCFLDVEGFGSCWHHHVVYNQLVDITMCLTGSCVDPKWYGPACSPTEEQADSTISWDRRTSHLQPRGDQPFTTVKKTHTLRVVLCSKKNGLWQLNAFSFYFSLCPPKMRKTS